MDPFLTIYRKDFSPKPLVRTIPFTAKSEFRDPLNEAFRTFLYLPSQKAKSDLQCPEEDADEYLEKLKKSYSYLANSYYKDPIDKSILERSFLLQGKSVYQEDYCNLDEDEKARKERADRGFRLPDDVDIPATTQKFSYRDPTMLNTAAAKPPPPVRPRHNLVPDENLRKILNVTTGRTEYQAEIGELGNIIIEDAVHGKIVHLKCRHHSRR